jgi:hypothetical protein
MPAVAGSNVLPIAVGAGVGGFVLVVIVAIVLRVFVCRGKDGSKAKRGTAVVSRNVH